MDPNKEYPLDDVMHLLIQQMEDLNYSKITVHNTSLKLIEIEEYMHENGIPSYIPDVGQSYIEFFCDKGNWSRRAIVNIHMLIRRLNQIYYSGKFSTEKETSQCEDNYVESIESFLEECKIKGNSASTIRWKKRICLRIAGRLVSLGCNSPDSINTTFAANACLEFNNDKESWAVVRAYFLYLYNHKIIKNDFSLIVPRYTLPKKLPEVYSMEQVITAINSLPTGTSREKRDYCMTLFVARFGLRPIDVVTLKLGDIDFSHKRFHLVQHKTNVELEFQIPDDLFEALTDYIKNSRPKTEYDEIFMTSVAPYKPVGKRVLHKAIFNAFKNTLTDATDMPHGPRSLRASLASSMVNSEVPYQVVSKVLGHTSLESIKNYARIDIENLRFYALPAAPATGHFQEMLKGVSNT